MLRRTQQASSGASTTLRDALIAELAHVATEEDLISWAERRFPAKKSLGVDDAQLVEETYRTALGKILEKGLAAETTIVDVAPLAENGDDSSKQFDDPAISLPKENRQRSKAHLAFVRTQPCLVCQCQPADAHHLKFAQGRALGRKVSDEFTVPVCRDHHHELHRHGDERAWWANLRITPLESARELWEVSISQSSVNTTAKPL